MRPVRGSGSTALLERLDRSSNLDGERRIGVLEERVQTYHVKSIARVDRRSPCKVGLRRRPIGVVAKLWSEAERRAYE